MNLPKEVEKYVYYRESNPDLIVLHGDCLEIMPLLPKVDLVVTDPPYGIGADRNLRADSQYGNALALSKNYEREYWDIPPTKETFNIIIEMSKRACIFGGNYFDLPSPQSCWLVWDKDNGNNGYADCELAWTNFKKAVRKFRFQWMGMLQENMKEKEFRYHPTQKPVSVIKFAIQQADIEWSILLDPFLGSGTTLVACKELNRCGIGIEISEKYCEIAKRRLLNTPRPLFTDVSGKCDIIDQQMELL